MCTVWPSKLSAAIGRSVVRSFGKDRSSSRSSTTNNGNKKNTNSTPLNNSLAPNPALVTATNSTTTTTTTITTTTTTTANTNTTTTNTNTTLLNKSITLTQIAVTTTNPTPSTAAITTNTNNTNNTNNTTSNVTTNSTISNSNMSGSKKDGSGGGGGGGGGGSGGGGTRDLPTEARNFSSIVSNVFLLKKRDQQSRHLLEKAQSLIDALLAENQKLVQTSTRSGPATPRQPRSAGSMGQLWVKLDELKRENDDLRRQLGRSQDDRSASPKDNKGPGDVIINDLQKTKTDNESLRNQVTQLQKTVRELQTIHSTVQDEYKRSKAALDAAQRSVEKARYDFKKLDASFSSLKTENESLKQKLSINSSPAKSNSSTMSPVPMPRTDNRMTENISELCRPTTIALRYNNVESQQWVDAKEAIEDDPHWDLDEGQIVRLLCEGLMSTYTASQRLFSNVELVMSELLSRPTLATAVIESRLVSSSCQCSPLSDDLADIIKQKLRQTNENVDTDAISKMAEEHQDTETRSSLQTLSGTSKAVHSYLAECATLTWQMALQNPPMRLVADDPTFDDVRHKFVVVM